MDVILPSRVIPEPFTYLMRGAHQDFTDHLSQIGNHERTRRDNRYEGQHHPTQDFRGLYFFQRTRRLLAKLGVHRLNQGPSHCVFSNRFPPHPLTYIVGPCAW